MHSEVHELGHGTTGHGLEQRVSLNLKLLSPLVQKCGPAPRHPNPSLWSSDACGSPINNSSSKDLRRLTWVAKDIIGRNVVGAHTHGFSKVGSTCLHGNWQQMLHTFCVSHPDILIQAEYSFLLASISVKCLGGPRFLYFLQATYFTYPRSLRCVTPWCLQQACPWCKQHMINHMFCALPSYHPDMWTLSQTRVRNTLMSANTMSTKQTAHLLCTVSSYKSDNMQIQKCSTTGGTITELVSGRQHHIVRKQRLQSSAHICIVKSRVASLTTRESRAFLKQETP